MARWTGSSRRLPGAAIPRTLWPEVRSIIVLAMNYGPAHDPLAVLKSKDRAAISVYAQNRDYHDIIKGKLKGVAGKLAAKAGCDVKVFVDTAPVMEKPLAEAAGIGWQGKHTNLVSREHGSWLFLGIDLHHRRSGARRSRDRPLRILPRLPRCLPDRRLSRALPARRPPLHFLPHHREQGCRSRMNSARRSATASMAATTASQSVPGTNSRGQASELKLRAREDLREPRLADLLGLDDAGFRGLFSGSPVKRIGRDRFMRNVLIAAGNSGDPSLAGRVGRCSTMLRRWCAARPSGRSADCSRPNLSGT